MMNLGSLAFAAPWILLGFAVLPILWWLLRVTPPAPKRVICPARRRGRSAALDPARRGRARRCRRAGATALACRPQGGAGPPPGSRARERLDRLAQRWSRQRRRGSVRGGTGEARRPPGDAGSA